MTAEIKKLSESILVGINLPMSLTNNQTGKLWSAFEPLVKSIPNRKSSEKISLQIYPDDYFSSFNPNTEFIKWAGVLVNKNSNIPENLNTLIIPEGAYAVFNYLGPANNPQIFQYIFTEWLPNSGYQLDNRPHFEVLGEKYSNTSPDSEEEIWIPIK
ncbi:GyrI-like domain-containing protein [Marinigracilibium pacificum]|uniref:GyrI-like domain-containing protein n=1 Tax=Marinigracilibium pacificum TaxID=2729599 RepID=A0A848IWA4_9BACT|nr:GyrI-like domain-containing protein [Marinigracilibium pacificum]NMM47531.1 GyrI-like domain-containing protein [Marinigracilibium pacificum]